MPKIYSYHCNNCNFSTKPSFGFGMYVTNSSGEEIICSHPSEHRIIAKELNISVEDAFSWLTNKKDTISPEVRELIESSIKYKVDHICLDCFHLQEIDAKAAKLACDNCSSSKIIKVRELGGQVCPKCKQGEVFSKYGGIA